MLEIVVGAAWGLSIAVLARTLLDLREALRVNRHAHYLRFLELADEIVDSGDLSRERIDELRSLMIDIDALRSFTALERVVQRMSEGPLPDAMMPSEAVPASWAHMFYEWALAVTYLRSFRGITLRRRLNDVIAAAPAPSPAGVLERRFLEFRVAA